MVLTRRYVIRCKKEYYTKLRNELADNSLSSKKMVGHDSKFTFRQKCFHRHSSH